VRARALETHLRAVVALSVAVMLGLGLVACGAARPRRPTTRSPTTAQSVRAETASAASALVQSTFDSRHPIGSGRVSLSMILAPDGSDRGAAPISLSLSGPFQGARAQQVPRFAFQIDLREGGHGGAHAGAGHDFHVGATSIEGQLLLQLQGTVLRAPASALRALQQGYGAAQRGYVNAGHATRSRPDGPPYGGLAIDPGDWLEHPEEAGTTRSRGGPIVHLVAGLNAAVFLRDAARLWGLAGALASGHATAVGSLTNANLSSLIDSARSGRVDLYAGRHDHLLRRLALSVTLSTTPHARAALNGLSKGVMRLELRFAELNQPQTIEPPQHVEALRQSRIPTRPRRRARPVRARPHPRRYRPRPAARHPDGK
jgi:hypothetical protein